MSVALQMVRAHILLAADCMGRFIKFRLTANEQEIAEGFAYWIVLYDGLFFFYKHLYCLRVYSNYLTPKDLDLMLAIALQQPK